jgi:hypothetical protein
MVVAFGTALAVGIATNWRLATALPAAVLAAPNSPSPTSVPRARTIFIVVRRGTKRFLIEPPLFHPAQFVRNLSDSRVGCDSAPSLSTLRPRFWSVNRGEDDHARQPL